MGVRVPLLAFRLEQQSDHEPAGQIGALEARRSTLLGRSQDAFCAYTRSDDEPLCRTQSPVVVDEHAERGSAQCATSAIGSERLIQEFLAELGVADRKAGGKALKRNLAWIVLESQIQRFIPGADVVVAAHDPDRRAGADRRLGLK